MAFFGVKERTAIAAGFVAVVMIVGAVELGARVPGTGLLDAFSGARRLDYAQGRGGFLPLNDAYVSGLLGGTFRTAGADQSAATAGRGAIARGDRFAEGARASGPQAPRVVLAHTFTNDAFADAITIESIPFVAKTDTRRASAEPGEPSACAPVGGTAWYRYTALSDGGIFANTFGTSYTVALGVFSGTALNALTSIGCDKSPTGNAQAGFAATKGVTYYFQLAGPVGGGDLVFEVSPVQTMERANMSSSGEQSDRPAYLPTTSGDGRFVPFYTWNATTLADPSFCPASSCSAIYLRDRAAGRTSVAVAIPRATESAPYNAPMGAEPDLWESDISADGHYLAFYTDYQFGPDDTNAVSDIFVADLRTTAIERVSLTSDDKEAETPADSDNRRPDHLPGSKWPAISADGRYVVFTSDASNLVPGDSDTNASNDVFVRDRVTGRTEKVSVDPNGAPFVTADEQWGQSISPDGRYVVFRGLLRNPTVGIGAPYPHSTDESSQVYVRDRLLGTTSLVSPAFDGGLGTGDSYFPAVSADGRYVSFVSEAANLVPGDTNGQGCGNGSGVQCGVDYFTYDRAMGRMTRDSVSSSGKEQLFGSDSTGVVAGYISGTPRLSMSDDGRYVAFNSGADNLVEGDTNKVQDVFVHDRLTGSTIRVSVAWTGAEANDFSEYPTLAGDGSCVTFESDATNLVPRDSNGQRDIFVYRL